MTSNDVNDIILVFHTPRKSIVMTFPTHGNFEMRTPLNNAERALRYNMSRIYI